jgi:putative transposase
MPDHVHFFCAPGIPDFPPVRRWVGYWKRMVGENEPRLKSVFLADCWDTQMRNCAHYEEILSYVLRNPERKGLVSNGEAWPFQGKIFDLAWL